MKLSYKLYELNRKYPFSISGYTFTVEKTVYVSIEHDGITGYGEAAPGYYFDETMEEFTAYLDKVDLSKFNDPEKIDEILEYCAGEAQGKLVSARAAIDIALHDLVGKLRGIPAYKLYDVDPSTMPETTFTIGIDKPEMIRKKVQEVEGFKRLKVKLGSPYDKEIVETIRSVSDLPLTVDANQGWLDKHEALEMIHWLNERNTIFIEQPMPRDRWDDNAWITENSPLPTVGDEAILGLNDVPKAKGVYTGFNIKMVKCGGIREGYKMIQKAKELDLKVMIGCMGESSVGILGAATIAPLCDWIDLDSSFLFTNNPYKDPELKEGKIQLSDVAGLGLEKR